VRPARGGPLRVEIIGVGRELLRGRVVDANSSALARLLSRRGALVERITIVDDQEAAISAAVREALGRNPHLVVTTGGLGPGEEDHTLAGVSDALGLPLVISPQAKAMVEAAHRRLLERRLVADTALTAARERMCRLPVGATPVANPIGVSPGVICRLSGGTTVVCLPGMPDEVERVFREANFLLRLAGTKMEVAQREIESPTADETALSPLLDRLAGEFPSVWIDSHPARSRRSGSRIVISLEASAASRQEANSTVEVAVRRLLALAAGSP
jgi:molybdenum cofactor synthesis domain-containing protein